MFHSVSLHACRRCASSGYWCGRRCSGHLGRACGSSTLSAFSFVRSACVVFHMLMHFSHVLHGVFLVRVMLRMMMLVHDDVFAIRGLPMDHLLDFFLRLLAFAAERVHHLVFHAVHVLFLWDDGLTFVKYGISCLRNVGCSVLVMRHRSNCACGPARSTIAMQGVVR